ncbi:hypothetical protein [Pontibacter sp. G13]|uniref:hypothetical protein n=1 Tax=Pontibacter sp. G13 TaxID=3074898 RepID=UPI002889CB10|nr:hypothetical protein [Pontibacter sp. G13]WNJ17400.1 hypothetical protein RJD25_21335 [Pontibacter sp. G13]
MRYPFIILFLACMFTTGRGWAQTSATQSPATEQARLKVYIDCNRCDMNYLRETIPYLDYVRDPQLAQVHVFVTNQATASNSRTYYFDFIGKESFEEIHQELSYTAPPNTAQDTERGGLARTLELGMVPYLLRTGVADYIQVKVKAPNEPVVQDFHDPWNFWVFQVYSGGNLNLESQKQNWKYWGGVKASRTTEEWRFRSHAYLNRTTKRFIDGEGDTTFTEINSSGFNANLVKSIDRHWSIGFFSHVYSSTWSNMDLGFGVHPALEFSVFPYEEVNRREFTIAYRVGPSYNDYTEETVFGKLTEQLWNQSLVMNVRVRQPWGSLFAGVTGSHFFHDFAKNRLKLHGSINLRVVKGLALNVSARYELINDQLSLKAGDVSQEDLLLAQTQLATSYKMTGSVGVNYTFGSMYNNVVNTRL